MGVISERVHKENDVAYMSDDLGVHRMSNAGSDFAVSLHCRFCPVMGSERVLTRSQYTRRRMSPREGATSSILTLVGRGILRAAGTTPSTGEFSAMSFSRLWKITGRAGC